MQHYIDEAIDTLDFFIEELEFLQTKEPMHSQKRELLTKQMNKVCKIVKKLEKLREELT